MHSRRVREFSEPSSKWNLIEREKIKTAYDTNMWPRESVSRWGEAEHENWKRRISRIHIGRIIYADAKIFVNYERKDGKQRVFFRFI